jgi:hypothetical protein
LVAKLAQQPVFVIYVGVIDECSLIALSGTYEGSEAVFSVITNWPSFGHTDFKFVQPITKVVLHVLADVWVFHGLHGWPCKQRLSSDDELA